MTTSTPLLDSRAIGVAHYAARAVLERRVAPYGLTFAGVLLLRQLATSGGPLGHEALIAQLGAAATKPADVVRTIEELTSAGLLEPDGPARTGLTDAGRELYAKVSAETAAVASRIYAGISDEDRAVVGRVLALVTERATAELAALDGQ